jgi:hypothetical protein
LGTNVLLNFDKYLVRIANLIFYKFQLCSWPWGFVALTTRHPLSAKAGTNFADKRRSVGRSVGIVRWRTKATEFFLSEIVYFQTPDRYGTVVEYFQMPPIAEHTAVQRSIRVLHWLYQQRNYPNVAFGIAFLGCREIQS